MLRKLQIMMAAALAAMLLCSAACAENVTLEGTVVARESAVVYAPVGGTVAEVCVTVGQTVAAGDVIARLKTTKVYATEAGTVTGVFGQPGDDAATVAERYGTVVAMERESTFTISASTSNAYGTTENKLVHMGETVYLASRSNFQRTGVGLVTEVSGTNFTVEVTEGDFDLRESCDVFRSAEREVTSRIGRGSTSRIDPVAISGEGSIVSFAVKPGDTVKRGQLLFETVEGGFDGLEMTGAEIRAQVGGVVASVSVEAGATVSKDATVAVIYPEGAMRLETSVSEADLPFLTVGDPVEIEMNWNAGSGAVLSGRVAMISAVAAADAEKTTYQAYVDFTPDADTRYGMTAVISTVEAADQAR